MGRIASYIGMRRADSWALGGVTDEHSLGMKDGGIDIPLDAIFSWRGLTLCG